MPPQRRSCVPASLVASDNFASRTFSVQICDTPTNANSLLRIPQRCGYCQLSRLTPQPHKRAWDVAEIRRTTSKFAHVSPVGEPRWLVLSVSTVKLATMEGTVTQESETGPKPRFMTQQEVARELACSTATVRNLIDDQLLQGVKLNGRKNAAVRVSRASFEAYCNKIEADFSARLGGAA